MRCSLLARPTRRLTLVVALLATLLVAPALSWAQFEGANLKTLISAADASHARVTFYLQHAETGRIVYFVPVDLVTVEAQGQQLRYRAKLKPADLDGVDVQSWSDMRWSTRVDARKAKQHINIDRFVVHSGGADHPTAGPTFNVLGEVAWVISDFVQD